MGASMITASIHPFQVITNQHHTVIMLLAIQGKYTKLWRKGLVLLIAPFFPQSLGCQ
jgi:hypothetical protein